MLTSLHLLVLSIDREEGEIERELRERGRAVL